jgi:hypothetical protein
VHISHFCACDDAVLSRDIATCMRALPSVRPEGRLPLRCGRAATAPPSGTSVLVHAAVRLACELSAGSGDCAGLFAAIVWQLPACAYALLL